jgi:hypothetical protein
LAAIVTALGALLYGLVALRIPLGTERYLRGVTVLSRSDRVYVFIEWESDKRVGTCGEMLKFWLFGILWNPEDVHVQNMLSIVSYADSDGQVCTTRRVDRPIGPIAPYGTNNVFWKNGLDGWDGKQITSPGRDVLERMPTSQQSDFIMALEQAGWTVTQSDIDPQFMFINDAQVHGVNFQTKTGRVDLSFSGGNANEVRKSIAVGVNGSTVYDFIRPPEASH